MEKYSNKFRDSHYLVYFVEGGKHHHQIAIFDNIGLTWKQRDSLTNSPVYWSMKENFQNTVLPNLEEENGGEILLYQKNLSSSAIEEWPSKLRINVLSIQYSPPQEFSDILKKNQKAFETSAIQMSIFSNAGLGSGKLFFMRKFPNGWIELDSPNPLKSSFEQLYGKGSYDKDMATIREFVTENDIIFLTLIPELSKLK